jgi:hypothetical protein
MVIWGEGPHIFPEKNRFHMARYAQPEKLQARDNRSSK